MRFRPARLLVPGVAMVLGLALSCSGGGGGGGTPPTPPPTISSFTATPATVTNGGTSTLAWSVSSANSLGIDQGVGTVTGTSKSVSPTATTTYTLTATNAGGNAMATATVTVVPPPAIASLTAAPGIITAGGSSTLSWTVTGATGLSIDQGVGAVTGTSKSVSPAATTTYSLTATNAAGASVTSAVTVTVVPPPAITSFTANPAAISTGQSSTLSWVVSGAASLSLNQGIGAVTGTSRAVSPATTTTYSLTATNAAGAGATALATVTVTARTTQVNLHVKVGGSAVNATWAAYQDGVAGAWVPITGAAGEYTFTLQDPTGLFSVALAYTGTPGTQNVTRVVQATIADLDALAPASQDPPGGTATVVRDFWVPVPRTEAEIFIASIKEPLTGTFSGLIDGEEVVDIYAYNKFQNFLRGGAYVGNGSWTLDVPQGTYDIALCKIKFLDSTLRSMKMIRGVDLSAGAVALPPENVTSWLPVDQGQIAATLPMGAGGFYGRGSYCIDGAERTFPFKIPTQEGVLLGYGNSNPFTYKVPAASMFGPDDSAMIHLMGYDGSITATTEAKVFFKTSGMLPAVTLPNLLPAPVEWKDTAVPGTSNSDASVNFGVPDWWATLAAATTFRILTDTPGVARKETVRTRAYQNHVVTLGSVYANWFQQATVAGLPAAYGNPTAIQHTVKVEVLDQLTLDLGSAFQKEFLNRPLTSNVLIVGRSYTF